jgi:protein TonB
MVKLALTMSSFDRIGPRPLVDSDAAPERKLEPAAFSVRVASNGIALGAVPAAFREWRAHAAWRRPGMRAPAVLGTVALHTAALALILIVERSLVAPVPLPAMEVSLSFEAAPQPAASASRESFAAPAPGSPPDEAPAAPEPPAASEPPIPPVALAPPDPTVAPLAEVAPPSAAAPPPAVAKPPPPKPPAVPKTRVNAPVAQQPRRPAPPPAPSAESAIAAASPSLPTAAPSAAPQPAQLASVPIVPPQPVGGALGNRKPDYPMVARSRGLQGLVLLRVNVAPSGIPIAVTVAASSGHPILDEAAVAVVRTWRFSPATQAGVPVAAFADVPVHFSIAD